jgi:uncharacterized membrane protein YqjE
MFFTVPVLRVASILRGRQDEHVPCITDGVGYDVVTERIEDLLRRHALNADRSEPSWWLAGPSKFLTKLGGKALRGYTPDHLAYWKGPDLEIAFYPSDILVRGTKTRTAWTHGLLAETISRGPGLQTFDPLAQYLERQIQQVWRVYLENPAGHANSRRLLSRTTEIAQDLGKVNVPYEAWQIVYRETLQLERALRGDFQILESLVSPKEVAMEQVRNDESANVERPLASASTGELVGKLASETAELVKKQVDLAKAEIRADLKNEVRMAEGLGLAGVCAVATLNMLLVALILALSDTLAGWTAALIVAGAMLGLGAIAAAFGWSKRVKRPLDKTQKTLQEDARWAKERMT